VILLELNLTKLKLEYFKSSFKGRKERYHINTDNLFVLPEFFRVQLKFALLFFPNRNNKLLYTPLRVQLVLIDSL